MNARAADLSSTWRMWLLLGGLSIGLVALGLAFGRDAGLELTYTVFVTLAGFAMGSLALLMIGLMMNEAWVAPIRTEAEAAGLTLPLLIGAAIPLAFHLERLFPWAVQSGDLPSPRTMFLEPGFFMIRSLIYLLVGSGIAVALVRTPNPRRTSAAGLFLLTPVMTFSAYDWVMSRDPSWWSSLFGFAFGLNQVLAALAGAILLSLLKREHPAPARMQGLERSLLTLSLLSIWTWFSQFLIIWLADLPQEVAWYLDRAHGLDLALVAGAFGTLLLAVVVLIPSGVSRGGMIVGSALVLVQHGLGMIWILQPAPDYTWADLMLASMLLLVGGGAFTVLMRARPTYAEETSREP